MMKKTPLALFIGCAMAAMVGMIAPSQAEDLVAVYAIAVENDAQLRAAKAARDAVRLNEPLARSRLLPAVGVTGGLSQNHNDSDGLNRDYTNGRLGISLSQTVYQRGYSLQLDQARDQLAQADTEYLAQQQALMLRVANEYFGILAAQDNLEFVHAQNAAIDRQLDQAKQRFDVGLIAVTPVHEAQAASDQARADLILAQNRLDNAHEALREIIQTDLNSVNRLAAGIPLEPPQPDDVDGWVQVALEQNPAILGARQGLEIARKEIEVQRATRSPSVDLVASHSMSHNLGDLDTDQNNTSIGVEVSMPLWLGGRVRASTDQARMRFEQAKELAEQQRRAVNRQVRDAYRAVVAGISAVRALEAGIVSAQSALEATQAGFDVGTRTMVDVLNAERDLFSVKSKHAASRYQYVLAGLQLRQAAGTLSSEDLERINGWLN